MEQLEKLLNHIAARVSVNLRDPQVDVAPYVLNVVPRESHSLYYAFYALTTQHPLYFRFDNSSLAGSYFLGKVTVDHSVLYKSDIRGDELKPKGTEIPFDGGTVVTNDDEVIDIKHSFLVKTLVHNNSHDPEHPENFTILNTVSLHYANIHGTRVEGSFIGPFATVDLSVCRNCEIGAFSYVQAGELSHQRIQPGRIWVKAGDTFEFNYTYPEGVVEKYISFDKDFRPQGEFIDFFDERKEDFIPIYATIQPEVTVDVPPHAFVSQYAVVKGDSTIGKRVLVSQRAYIENSDMGRGSNAQEQCHIVDSVYEGFNVTAHGGRVINARLGRKTFTGFNSFVRGQKDAPIEIGEECIVMPHTIIDAQEPIKIPAGHAIWGLIRTQADLETQTLSLEKLAATEGEVSIGRMTFKGSGKALVDGFRHRIEHILEENGAYYDGEDEATKGHAQKTQRAAYNILQPFATGRLQGMYPKVEIGPELPDV